MSLTAREREQLCQVLGKLRDGALSDDELRELRTLVAADAEARQLYLEHAFLVASLRWTFSSSDDTSFKKSDVATTPIVPMATDHFSWLSVFSGGIQFFGSSRYLVAAGLMLAVGLTASWLYLSWFSAGDRQGQLGGLAGGVAVITTEKECVWQADSEGRLPYVGQRLESGELLILDSGVAELTFADGARVAIEGPSTLELQATGKGYLRSGKLAAHVPTEAIGFEVETPTARVVDLGTDFRLEVQPEETRCAVATGETELFARNLIAGGDNRVAGLFRRLVAGQAVAITTADNGSTAMRDTQFDPKWLSTIAPSATPVAHFSTAVAYQFADAQEGNQSKFSGGVGLDFDVRIPIRVIGLGVFDHLGDGIHASTSPTVQLWLRDPKDTPNDTSDDEGLGVIVTQLFKAGDVSQLKQGHRFLPSPIPIDLPPGSYSIVAYDLAEGNPFLAALGDAIVPRGSTFHGGIADDALPSSVTLAGNGTVVSGKIGGTFARNEVESYYGDTHLSQTYTLETPLSASGQIAISDAETVKDGKCFVGHFSSSTDDQRREFIGLEFVRGDTSDRMAVRARIHRFNGDAVSDAASPYMNLIGKEWLPTPCRFEYSYDPTYENDDNHPGPEGRLALRVFNDAGTMNSTMYAINDGTHRDAGSSFDSFGIGIGAMSSMRGNYLRQTVKVFADDLAYSGHEGMVDFNTDPGWTGVGNRINGNDYGWVQSASTLAPAEAARAPRVDAWRAAITPVGSRLGDCRAGEFPRLLNDKRIGYGAGSFEFVVEKGGQQR